VEISNLTYVSGDLFKVAPKHVYLAHACNCMGTWGAGVAKAFKLYYPTDYIEYNKFCLRVKPEPGEYFITKNNIICLFTSRCFGNRVDSPEHVIKATKEALDLLFDPAEGLPINSEAYSPKFNSGLFRVPWPETANLLEQGLSHRPDVKWTVVEYE